MGTFYVRYMHMQQSPRRANGVELQRLNTVSAGEHVGTLGNTGSSTAAHLHMDVHRNFNPINTSFANTIDPRVFYADRIMRPWLPEL